MEQETKDLSRFKQRCQFYLKITKSEFNITKLEIDIQINLTYTNNEENWILKLKITTVD